MTLYADYTQIGNNKYYHRDLEARELINNLGALASKSKAALATDVSGILPIANGGTGASSAADARYALGVVKSLPTQSYYVSTSGNDTTGDGTENKPFRTIQKAVDECPYVRDTTIYVAPGTYNENVAISGKKISLYNSSGSSGGNVTINGTNDTAFRVHTSAICYLNGNFVITTSANNVVVLTYSSVLSHTSGTLKVVNAKSGANAFLIYRDAVFYMYGESTLNISTVGYGMNIYGASIVTLGTVTGSVSSTLFSVSGGSIVHVANYSGITYGTAAVTGGGGRIYSGAQSSLFNY